MTVNGVRCRRAIAVRLLYKLADLMDQCKEELATIEALDSGAVYTLALKTHIGMSIENMAILCRMGRQDSCKCLFCSYLMVAVGYLDTDLERASEQEYDIHSTRTDRRRRSRHAVGTIR